ncbi:tRNA threonylcarbamoyladenosine dehydratase isoform X4 [Cryptomeria japonica]|uniref:tRNA threonylcarbamoyladenosine dehydratase isoform X4 n=1 Tax=Cryptomeria japonica TaxID=3369 RepID=UPI0025AC9D35|nr:tRNA threonylcarbamoyladenosine dehydratase isoform X4 [Cryptomeria japonica]
MPKNHSIILLAAGAALGSSLTLALLKLISRCRNKSLKNSRQAVSSIQYKGQEMGIDKNGYNTSSIIEREANAKAENDLFSDDLLKDEIVHEHLTRNIQFFGLESQQKVNKAFVVVIGLGGVGSHAATMLLRSGVGRIRIVDFDQVSLSSLNRHAVATRDDVGTSKALCLKTHFQSIFPESQIDARVQLYDASSEEDILGGQPDFILDCIDNIDTKVSLLAACVRRGLKVLSATGAGARADPTRIRIADLSESSTDPLSRAVRHRLRREHGIDGGISVVFSLEKPKVKLLPFKAPNGEEENPSEYQVDVEEVVYIVKELWRGKSARDQASKDVGRGMWRSVNNLTLTRWDRSKPASVTNLILLKFKEAEDHDTKTLDELKMEEPMFYDMVTNVLKQATRDFGL